MSCPKQSWAKKDEERIRSKGPLKKAMASSKLTQGREGKV